MMKIINRSILFATTSIAGAHAAVISTEQFQLNDFTGLDTGTPPVIFTETFTGSWGSFDLDISVTPTGTVVLNGVLPEHANTDYMFGVASNNVMLNAGYSLTNLSFTEIKFNAGGATTDSGVLTVPAGAFTWLDGNDPIQMNGGASSDPLLEAAHNESNNRFDLVLLNGGNAFTSLTSANVGGTAYRINDVRATVDVNMIPEPASASLLGLGGLILLVRRRR